MHQELTVPGGPSGKAPSTLSSALTPSVTAVLAASTIADVTASSSTMVSCAASRAAAALQAASAADSVCGCPHSSGGSCCAPCCGCCPASGRACNARHNTARRSVRGARGKRGGRIAVAPLRLVRFCDSVERPFRGMPPQARWRPPHASRGRRGEAAASAFGVARACARCSLLCASCSLAEACYSMSAHNAGVSGTLVRPQHTSTATLSGCAGKGEELPRQCRCS